MAIIIQSLEPTSPSTPAGSGVTFTVSAFDDGGATLSYEWQFSTDGVNYTSAGLTNNTSISYNTGPLTINQSGIYYRVAVSNGSATLFSNEYPGIGDRSVTVFQDPSIISLLDATVDFYPTNITKSVGDNLELIVTASLINADITNTTLVSGINFEWQVSTDSGNNWTVIAPGGDTTITNVVQAIQDVSPTSYLKKSTLLIQNLTFANNLYQYRVVISYTGAVNTPVTLSPVSLLIDPIINIYQQPGTGVNDTIQTNCYKTSIINSGEITLQIGALTTANTQLSYDWQVNFGDNIWISIETLLTRNQYIFELVPGTTFNTDLLRLQKFIYYENLKFRCVINGTSGEASVTSSEHRVFMNDIQVAPVLVDTSYNVVESNGAVVVISADVDISRNNGINGNRRFIWERSDPGSSSWYEIGDEVVVNTINSATTYTQFPTTNVEFITPEIVVNPITLFNDNGARYRLKVESSAIYTLSGNPLDKTIIPYYSDEITLNVYRTVIILNQPNNSRVYANQPSSFGVTATVSSGSTSDITYQWQYNTTDSDTGWLNVPNSGIYSGVNTNLLVISSTPQNPVYDWFRCVVSVSGELSSVTTSYAQLTTSIDYFRSISSINDVFVRQFENVTFSIIAFSLSNSPITYQWQKSTNYSPFTNTATWVDLVGETTNTLNLVDVSSSDAGFYRLKLTSFGGVVEYSNAAQLIYQPVQIDLLQDITSSISILEGQPEAYIFECEGVSSVNTEVEYQWQIKRVGDSSFTNIGTGFNNSSDTNRRYVLRALDAVTDNGAKIRCRLRADEVPDDIFTTECDVSVTRRFTYFADVANKQVTLGSTLTLDLNASFTGGSPTYMWQENGVDMGETQDVLVIPNIDSSYNGKVYRCRVTLDACTEHRYSRNNVVNTVTVTPPSAFTVNITISTVTAPSVPTYYSNETAKTGASIGTVVCIPKPAGYIEDPSASDDDIDRWKCSVSGTVFNTNSVSTVTSGSIWSSNKPSWASNSYISPKWRLNDDRFKGYIEMRGQYVKALDFPELARQWGTKFGGSITGVYPNYRSTDYFRMPMTYGKRLLGTGNVNNNSGSTSIVPLYDPNGLSGGDKNIPGTMGGQYNYEKSAQLPPGSPGLSGEADGTADGLTNINTFSLGSFVSTGVDEVEAFAQPSFSGTVRYAVGEVVTTFTTVPTHNHTAVSVGWRETNLMSTSGCSNDTGLAGSTFVGTAPNSGGLDTPTPCVGEPHAHGIDNIGPGSFDMVRDGGMGISDTTLRLTSAARSIFDNNMSFFLRNNEAIPLNAPYFRLKYMVKAY